MRYQKNGSHYKASELIRFFFSGSTNSNVSEINNSISNSLEQLSKTTLCELLLCNEIERMHANITVPLNCEHAHAKGQRICDPFWENLPKRAETTI